MKHYVPWKTLYLAGVVGLAVASFGANALAADAKTYYKGKRISLLIGTGNGSSADLLGRIIAHHLSKKIPGEPNIVPQNMPGSGSVVMMNFLYNKGRRDGTAMGIVVGGIYMRHILGTKGIRHDLSKMTPLYNPESGSTVIFSGKALALKKGSDIMKVKKPVNFGFGNPRGNSVLLGLAGFKMLGVPVHTISGYKNSRTVTLAVERGELDIGWNTAPGAYNTIVQPKVKSGEMTAIFQSGLWLPKSNKIVPHPTLKDVPTFDVLHREIKGKAPSGPLWEAWYLPLISAARYTVFFPPEVPKTAIDAMNIGFEAICADPKFHADLAKIKRSPKCYLKKEAKAITERSAKAPADVVAKLKTLLPKRAKKKK